MKRTPLFEEHLALGAKMAPFSGWEMPLHYGSQVREHHAVRQGSGVFDVSHMGIVDLIGSRVELLLRFLLSNDVARIPKPGQGQYSLMLNIRAGISDDLIVYRMSHERFFLIVNAATREKDVAWIRVHASAYEVEVIERQDLAILAVQGPEAKKHVGLCLPALPGTQSNTAEQAIRLPAFHFIEDEGWRIARTGYTGEDGFELIVPHENVITLWESFIRSGATPVGLGARDTLRLEAGLNLYGRDMDGETTPLEAGLGWCVAWEPLSRDFIGRQALEPLYEKETELSNKRVGLVLQVRGILRDQQSIFLEDQSVGRVTSGSYAPTLEKGIALARVASHLPVGALCQVESRGKRLPVRVVRPPFVRHGKQVYRLK